jgi:hypothetical protein
MHTEKIVILDFSTGEVFVYPISKEEDTNDFFSRKGFRESDIQWMRGDIKINIEDEIRADLQKSE